MYTIMEKEIVEKKLNESNVIKLKEELLPNQSENYYLTYTNESKSSENYKFFILSDNIQYLKGLSYEEVLLYIILGKLEDYIQLPNIIFYECFMNIMGQTIVISDKNLQPGYEEIDYALYSNQYFSFEIKESPFYVQSEYYYNENKFVNNKDEHIFKINKNRLYFFEFKQSLNYFKTEPDTLDNKEEHKNKTKNPHTFLIKLINKCMVFKDLYVNKLSIPNDTPIEIIIFYDDNISRIFDSCLNTIQNILANKNIKLSLIYVLSSYPFYSLRTEIEKNRKFMEEHNILKKQYNNLQNQYNNLQNQNNNLQKQYETVEDEQEKLKKSFKELQEKFVKMEKEKSGNKNNVENKTENNTEENAKK